MKNISVGLILLIVLFSNGLYAQKKDDLKKETIERAVTSRNYVFKAETVMPTGAVPNRQLSYGYDLRVSPDTIVSYLPYFGRAYTAPMDPSKGGIQFTSTKFEYKETKRKKGGWEILIKPKDTQDVSQMVLTVSETGFASLQVISNNRQPISFNGNVDEKKSKK
jgi:hypothetical protein